MESITLTYEELAERLGIGVDSAGIKARRMKSQGWTIQPPNRPGGKALVVIPEGALPEHLPERSGIARERYGETLGEHHAEALRELRESKERAECLAVEAAEARVEARLLRESLDRERDLNRELRTELGELRRPWWKRLRG
jgi:hypothetical protein